ncbi:PIG-L family deacetylase [bacterium]|nr:PIG-L family deacetylase [bacterium]
MQLHNPGAQLFVPDGTDPAQAIARTTQIAFMAHQDDIGIGAMWGVLQCFGRTDEWFTGVTVTNGAGSPRDDLYADYTDDQMQAVRAVEEKKAAFVGEYGACFLLDYPSSAVKDAGNPDLVAELTAILQAARPKIVYTHNLGDKHDTHVAVALRVIAAIRALPADARPQAVYGCEVWRDLDWMTDEDKVLMDCTAHENLAASLMGTYDSQICGGKRYDLATAGRRKAHATYHASHGVDVSQSLNFGMDLTPLIADANLAPADLLATYIQRFQDEVMARVGKMS